MDVHIVNRNHPHVDLGGGGGDHTHICVYIYTYIYIYTYTYTYVYVKSLCSPKGATPIALRHVQECLADGERWLGLSNVGAKRSTNVILKSIRGTPHYR